MKTQPIKRIIAREGLVLLGIIFLGAVIYFSGTHTSIYWEQYRVEPAANPLIILWAKGSLGLIVGIFGYPFYWLIRFVIWAIKTLGEDA